MAVLNDLIVQGSTRLVGDAIGTKFIVANGTASQFLKADGSLDSTSYSSATQVSTALSNKQDKTTSGTAAQLSAGTDTTQRVWAAANLKSGGDAVWQAKGSYLTGTTNYAGSSSQGGAATSANKINTDAGNTTTPVYFSGGVPTALSYTIAKSVPNNAIFTDTATTLSGHFVPTATTANTKTASASSTSELDWGSAVVTGVTLSGDAKGHITAVAVSSGKLKTPVTGSSLTAEDIIVGNGASAVKASGKSIETTLSSTLNTKVPTSKAVADYVSQQMASALTYKGSISSNNTLKNAHKVGDVYVVSSAGTYAGKACEVGDYLIANTTRASASTVTNTDWDAINGENQVENKSASLAAAGSSATIATVDGTNITITTPSTWTGVDKVGTLTGVTLASGASNGTLKLTVNGTPSADIAVKGLGSMAYENTSTYATTANFNSHSANTTVHVTSTEKTTWNGKLSQSDVVTAITPSTSASTNPVATSVVAGFSTSIEDLSGQSETIAAAFNVLNQKIIELENKVKYNGHEYVEIGGVKWATMNVGAGTVTDYGFYFQWGDTQGYTASQLGSDTGQKPFGWRDYRYGNGTVSPSVSGMTKYNSTDGKTVLGLEDDAVRANWGGQWRMPTTAEFRALGDAVNTEWINNYNGSGINGLLCTDKTDNSKTLFFPACGTCLNGNVYEVGSNGHYWSSSLYSNVLTAYYLNVYNGSENWQRDYFRHCGYSVRGVVG